eukprot:CAMPEP_0197620958 /NCGR_PEP_ID=MMETSP1338-20131121/1643_1 /TAXON_ID=43686 ORGANISM="Pelagodinium beii, Strain RCC1491" /NCGR_SAMPLE_ID=MMETSP1338 /ASSEMBLY_ACC=CAM_ASM_000754 /LENGTH=53 /DNA_ID=CAMNT_0043190275 /DNA_START=99 /DNA_END=258 /DNA_ORIENTATION=+
MAIEEQETLDADADESFAETKAEAESGLALHKFLRTIHDMKKEPVVKPVVKAD